MKIRIFFLLIIILLSVTYTAWRGRASAEEDFLALVDFKIENQPLAARIVLRTNRYFEYADYAMDSPAEPFVLALDPAEPLYTNIIEPGFDKEGLLKNVKIAKGAANQKGLPAMLEKGFYPVDYISFVFDASQAYRIQQRANLIIIDIPEKNSVAQVEPASPAQWRVGPVPAPSAPAVAGPAVLAQPARGTSFSELRDEVMQKALSAAVPGLAAGRNTFSYRDCLNIGTANFLPLIISEEETKLGDMKVKEARRALYPTATAKYVATEGKVYDVEFREKTYGMQVEQPLYYGGRLKTVVKQAETNREVSKAKYDKTEADLVSKVTEAFYNTATAQLNLDDQRRLLAESRRLLALAKEKYGSELSTRLEILNVQSQCDQIEYQMSVAVKDLEMAKVNLLQAIGLDPSGDIAVDFSLDYKEQRPDLNNCLLLAYKNRPELRMNELLRKASEYEQRIARSKDDFKVDLTGFVGQSGGAYKTEPLNMGDDWYVGIKASKPLAGNTASYSLADNKTSPKLGQTTRTEAISHTFEAGILNNLTGVSEKQSALIGKLKAENELTEAEKAINLEVREAHNNYEKAVIQIENTKNKIGFREEEVKVLRAQAELNEAPLSQVLEAMVKLNDERALYHQAIASYKSALASLNKAIGLIWYFE